MGGAGAALSRRNTAAATLLECLSYGAAFAAARQAPAMHIGTPLSPSATKVMLLGGGELGKEVIIALQRLGV